MIELKNAVNEAKIKLGLSNSELSKLIGHSRNHISETLRIGASTEKQSEITGKIKEAVAVELVNRGVGVMKSFEEQFVHEFYMGKNNKGEYIDDRTRMASFCYEAGQQSKQAEVDELQKRIDEALNVMCKLQYSSGERIYDEVGKILKGDQS